MPIRRTRSWRSPSTTSTVSPSTTCSTTPSGRRGVRPCSRPRRARRRQAADAGAHGEDPTASGGRRRTGHRHGPDRCRSSNGQVTSQPAVVGDRRRLDAVAGARLGDRRGEVVAHRALRQVQRAGDVGDRRPAARRDEDVALAVGQRRRPVGERRRGEVRVDDPLAGGDPADGVGELLGGGVLDDEAEGAGLHRPAQVARGDRTSSARARDTTASRRAGRRRRRARRRRASRCRGARRPAGSRAPRRRPRRPARPRRRR